MLKLSGNQIKTIDAPGQFYFLDTLTNIIFAQLEIKETRKRTNVHACAYTFSFCYVIIFVTLGIAKSIRYNLVLLSRESSICYIKWYHI